MSDNTDELRLYFWPTPNGYKVSVLLELFGLDYQIMPVNITTGEQHAPDFVSLFPTRKIPGLVHRRGSDQPDRVLVESGAILWYLADWRGQLLPSDPDLRWQVMQWLFWQVGGLGPIAGQAHHFRLYAPVKDDYAIDRYTKETHKFYAVLESQLSLRPFIAGDLSIADIAILPWIFRHQRQGVDLERYPAVKAWYAGLMARPEVIRGFEVGQSLINQGDFSADEARSHLF